MDNIKIYDVRMEKIRIQNFKNIRFGEISFQKNEKSRSAELLGVYGQNGSGKTSLIDSLTLLKNILSGRQTDCKFADFINLDSEYARLTYTFYLSAADMPDSFRVEYSFSLNKSNNLSDNNFDVDCDEYEYRPVISDEKIAFSVFHDGKITERMHMVIDTASDSYPFIPVRQYENIIGKDRHTRNELLAVRRVLSMTSRPFIFSRQFLNALRENKSYAELPINHIIRSLVYYGNFRLFIFDIKDEQKLGVNIIPLSFNIKKGDSKVIGNISIPFNGNGLIPEETYELAENIIKNMNIVLEQIVPGLSVSIKHLGLEVSEKNQRMCRVQLFSHKNSREIPLCYESEGIKKIISILHLLINVYNRYSFTVAIDELDSGVFEYLLGELINIISRKGRGQLIFTSHNLRPLETLDKSCIAFTTTNPDNRYIRPVNVKTSNNLRDFYYRDITLGENNEEVYQSTNSYEIALAFREAGEGCGS